MRTRSDQLAVTGLSDSSVLHGEYIGVIMFVILLRFSENKSKAGELMDGHNRWIKHGFDDGLFLLVGSLQTGLGGSIVAHNCSLSELQARLNEDPFVSENVVEVEILEIDAKMADERLSFLVNDQAL